VDRREKWIVDRKERVLRLLTEKFNLNGGCLRIVFLYPEAPKNVIPRVGRNGKDVVIVLDYKHSPTLFDDKVWNVLHSLKFETSPADDSFMTAECDKCKKYRRITNRGQVAHLTKDLNASFVCTDVEGYNCTIPSEFQEEFDPLSQGTDNTTTNNNNNINNNSNEQKLSSKVTQQPVPTSTKHPKKKAKK